MPGGCFQMGSPSGEKDRDDDEGPVHEVCVDGFWMGKFEVTNEQYRRFKAGHDSKDYKGKSLNGGSQPAVYVSWNDATAYAQWLSGKGNGTYRLPTESRMGIRGPCRDDHGPLLGRQSGSGVRVRQCRGPDGQEQTGVGTGPVHNCDDGYAVTAPVGSFKPNAFGLHDMMGNVWEWCQDWYAKDAYSKHSRQNPLVSGGGSARVYRGGSWFNLPWIVRSADRLLVYDPGDTGDCLGFRLLRTE